MGCLCDQICQIEAFEEVMEDDGVWMMWVVHMDIKVAMYKVLQVSLISSSIISHSSWQNTITLLLRSL